MNTPIQDPIAHACRLLREDAEELKSGHTLAKTGHDWTGEPEAKAAYDEHRAVADALERWESAIGAGGVEPLRRRECLLQIAEPAQAAPAAAAGPVMSRNRTKDDILHFLTKEQMVEEIIRLDAALAAAPTTQEEPAFIDSTPELHVGGSAFESWYSDYLLKAPVHQPMKQRARDAYAAGMGDPLVVTAPAAVAGPAYLCQAWGETDLPAAAIVHDMESVRAFLIEEWLGSEDDEDATGTKTLPEVMQELQNGWDENGDAWKWSVEFEIGGISVEKVGHSAPAAVAGPSVYVAARECAECNHVGINDEHEVDAACYFCGWNGVSPDEDRCPSCKKDGAMTAACPKCSGAYRLLADADIAAAPTTQAAPADTLAEIVGCIDAANAEGLDDALVNNTDARLTDLVQRRLLPAFYVAIAAQAAQQPAVQHAGALEACRAACDRIIEQYDGVTAGIDWHALRGGIDRALAAHPAAPVAQGDALDEVRRAVAAIAVVGHVDGHAVVRRLSVLDMLDRRIAARAQAKEGGEA